MTGLSLSVGLHLTNYSIYLDAEEEDEEEDKTKDET